jgi:hypothetical protein
MLKKNVPSAICDPSVSKVVLVTTKRTNTRESKAPKLTELQQKNAYAARANPNKIKTAEIKSPPSSGKFHPSGSHVQSLVERFRKPSQAAIDIMNWRG